MKSKLKQRIIGSLVALALIIIIVPIIFKNTRMDEQNVTPSMDIPVTIPSPIMKTDITLQANTNAKNDTQDTDQQELVKALNPEPDASIPVRCIVQVGSFSNITNVERVTQRLKNVGFVISINSVSLAGGADLKQVLVNSTTSCAQTIKQLESLDFDGFIVEDFDE